MLYNRHKNKKLYAGVIACLVFLLLPVGISIAETAVDQLNTEKQQRQDKLKEINKKIKDYTKQIDTTRKTSNSLKNEIAIFDKEILSTELQIQARQTQIEDANIQIFQLETLIQENAKQIEENKKVLSDLLVQLNGFDDEYDLKTALGSNNFSEFLDQVQHNQNFQEKIYQVSQKIKTLKLEQEKQQKNLKVKVQNLEELKHQLEITQKSITEQKSQKQKLLNQTRGLEKNYQTLLLASKKEEEGLEKEIQDLDNQIRSKLGKKSVLVGKGAIAWPMDGVLTQKYGNTGFTALGYNFHNGIDIAAPAGEPIYAVADGTVLYTDKSDTAYGNWVAIKHNLTSKSGSNKIVTLYGHMRSFKVSPGQEVKQGDLIGYEGNTGNTTKKLYGPERGYHIHFGVYDAEGFGVNEGKYKNIYGNYKIPYGYTYNPLEFLGSQN
jgi:murein DD-endopeptidase MepM/ murein hydrolase activator NlpD